MSTQTPMMKQYFSLKEEAGDALLFFRLGDFYEMFYDDAILAAKELEITLTARDSNAKNPTPMCGVPHHSAEQYISRLVEKGYKVAVCEQVENPAEAKGVVRREIVRTVTPGTLMDGKILNEKSNNFLVCVTEKETTFGLAACDLTTGELYVTSIHDSIEQLMDEVNLYEPSELLGDLSVMQQLLQRAEQLSLTEWTSEAPTLLTPLIQSAQNSELNEAMISAASRLLSYLDETQKRTLNHLTFLRVYEAKQYMTLDPLTRRNLELVETVRERKKVGSLLWLLDETMTSMGGRLLRRWIDQPLLNLHKIEERLEAVDVLVHHFAERDEIRQALKGIYDLERLVGKVSYGSANARDLLALQKSLTHVPLLAQLCSESESATLRTIVSELDLCQDIEQKIALAIEDEPPITIREGGMIRQGYDEELDRLKEASVNGKRWIAELEQKERERTGVRTLKVGFNKVFGYYIEISRANLQHVPEGLYERKQTLANAERFITPELKEKEALILAAEDQMEDLEYSLFIQLRNWLIIQIPRLQQLAAAIAQMDTLQSLATVSMRNRYCKPELHTGYALHIVQGRHPVVEEVSKDNFFVANDTLLTEDEQNVLLITGPNMAGKSTYMRQVAMICIMAQMGCFVPADQAKIPLIDRIFTRIGAADDLIGGQSTFMVEMKDIHLMTKKATNRSLVIIDELGRGTSTGEGMSIAQAVIEHLHDQVGCKTLVSTHFHELALLEDSLNKLKNYCMAVQESAGDVTFLRKLIEGAASTSYGIYCAQIAGLPSSIIERSYDLLQQFEHTRTNVDMTTKGVDEAKELLDVKYGQTEPVKQLSLFEEDTIIDEQTRQGSKKTSSDHLIRKKLQTIDLMNMTPMDAMNFLFELKKEI